MRLIDVDALKNIIEYNQSINPKLSVYDVLKIINNAHTITIKEWVAEMPIYIKDAMLEALLKEKR